MNWMFTMYVSYCIFIVNATSWREVINISAIISVIIQVSINLADFYNINKIYGIEWLYNIITSIIIRGKIQRE